MSYKIKFGTTNRYRQTAQGKTVNPNFMDSNNLGLLSENDPYRYKPLLETLFSAKHNYSGNAFSSLIGNASETINNTKWEQKVKADDYKPLVVVETIAGEDGYVGANGTIFKLKADINFYLPSDVIVPLRGSKMYQCRIQAGPIATNGQGYIYEVQYVDANGPGIPEQLLQVGQEWAKMFSTASEADIQGGSTQFNGYHTLHGKTGKLRKQHEITDYAHEMILATDFMQDGKTYRSWLPAIEAKLIKEFEMEKEYALVYGRQNIGVSSAVGYEVDTFPGLIEQLETSANNHYYSKFTINLLEEYLADIYFSRVNPGEVREITVLTGWHGLQQASKAMSKLVENGSWKYSPGDKFTPVNSTSSKNHPNSFSYGFNFTEYISDMGIRVKFVHMPLLDDRRFNQEVDPITGKNIESMRYFFLDFKGDMGSNIKKLEVANSYGFSYLRGLIGPEGRNHGKNPANSKESYSLHLSTQLGLKIDDISNCGMLVYQPNGLL